MKLCKDCKHFVSAPDYEPGNVRAIRYGVCGLTDPVGAGEGVRCYEMRKGRWFPFGSYYPYCGPNANQFEQRIP